MYDLSGLPYQYLYVSHRTAQTSFHANLWRLTRELSRHFLDFDLHLKDLCNSKMQVLPKCKGNDKTGPQIPTLPDRDWCILYLFRSQYSIKPAKCIRSNHRPPDCLLPLSLRDGCAHQNGWIFGKLCCGFRDKIATKVHMLIMAGLLCILLSYFPWDACSTTVQCDNWLKTYPKKSLLCHFHAEKALFNVQNLQYKFF